MDLNSQDPRSPSELEIEIDGKLPLFVMGEGRRMGNGGDGERGTLIAEEGQGRRKETEQSSNYHLPNNNTPPRQNIEKQSWVTWRERDGSRGARQSAYHHHSVLLPSFTVLPPIRFFGNFVDLERP